MQRARGLAITTRDVAGRLVIRVGVHAEHGAAEEEWVADGSADLGALLESIADAAGRLLTIGGAA